jgi:hypothetical protein
LTRKYIYLNHIKRLELENRVLRSIVAEERLERVKAYGRYHNAMRKRLFSIASFLEMVMFFKAVNMTTLLHKHPPSETENMLAFLTDLRETMDRDVLTAKELVDRAIVLLKRKLETEEMFTMRPSGTFINSDRL